MQAVAEKVIARAKELLASGEVQRVLGWEKGEFDYERTPALFEQGNIDKLVYDKFCAANLSKKLVDVVIKSPLTGLVKMYTGKAYITTFSLSTPAGDNATYSYSLTGSGNLTPADNPQP